MRTNIECHNRHAVRRMGYNNPPVIGEFEMAFVLPFRLSNENQIWSSATCQTLANKRNLLL